MPVLPYPDPGFNDMDPTGLPTGGGNPVSYPNPGFNDMDPTGLPGFPASAAPGTGGDNAMIQQFVRMLMSGGTGGAGGNFPGGGMMMPGMDPLGMGMGGDPLGMGGMMMGGGLNPAQAAGLRLQRNNKMNALRQNMANAHRAIGPAGGTDYSRHVQNVDDEIMALQEQKINDNIKNALAYDQMLMNYAQQNSARNSALGDWIAQALKREALYGKDNDQSPGTFSGAEGGADTQGTLP